MNGRPNRRNEAVFSDSSCVVRPSRWKFLDVWRAHFPKDPISVDVKDET